MCAYRLDICIEKENWTKRVDFICVLVHFQVSRSEESEREREKQGERMNELREEDQKEMPEDVFLLILDYRQPVAADSATDGEKAEGEGERRLRERLRERRRGENR